MADVDGLAARVAPALSYIERNVKKIGAKKYYAMCFSDFDHYYRIALCSKSFVPAAFGPGTIGGFCPGSNG